MPIRLVTVPEFKNGRWDKLSCASGDHTLPDQINSGNSEVKDFQFLTGNISIYTSTQRLIHPSLPPVGFTIDKYKAFIKRYSRLPLKQCCMRQLVLGCWDNARPREMATATAVAAATAAEVNSPPQQVAPSPQPRFQGLFENMTQQFNTSKRYIELVEELISNGKLEYRQLIDSFKKYYATDLSNLLRLKHEDRKNVLTNSMHEKELSEPFKNLIYFINNEDSRCFNFATFYRDLMVDEYRRINSISEEQGHFSRKYVNVLGSADLQWSETKSNYQPITGTSITITESELSSFDNSDGRIQTGDILLLNEARSHTVLILYSEQGNLDRTVVLSCANDFECYEATRCMDRDGNFMEFRANRPLLPGYQYADRGIAVGAAPDVGSPKRGLGVIQLMNWNSLMEFINSDRGIFLPIRVVRPPS